MSNEKYVKTRIQQKHDLEANWIKASSFIPKKGELIIYDIEVYKNENGQDIYEKVSDGNGGEISAHLAAGRTTPYNYERFKIGDGHKTVTQLPFASDTEDSTERDIKLAEDLYTYTNIGKITGASNTNPIKVASAGENLKVVFNKVFGVQQDQQPVINTNGVSLGVDDTATAYGGGEYGAAVVATDVTITFNLNNSATAQYGYRCGETKNTASNAAFKYAITQQSTGSSVSGKTSADIKITLPSGQTAASSMVTAGTYVHHSSNVLYCNFNTSNEVSIKISLAAGNVETSSQTRYNQIEGEVMLGDAITSNGTKIDSFLTYLEADPDGSTTAGANAIAALSGGPKSNTAGAYTISAGYVPYTYCLSSSLPTTLPTTNRRSYLPSSITVSDGTDTTYLYIFVPSSETSISTMTANGFNVPFTCVESSKSYVVNNSKSATYKVFKTDGAVKDDTFSIS